MTGQTGTTPPRVLLCRPEFYGIEYEINPWMNKSRGADHARAAAQWEGLRRTLTDLGCEVELLDPRPGLPDMVFTANAGLVAGRRFIGSSFRYPQRQGEEKHFNDWFAAHGYEVLRLEKGLVFEGEGDALACGDALFCGYHFRSDIQSHCRLGEILGRLVISLELVDARFYHLDTCFCPLAPDTAMWFPPAFDDYARRAVPQHVKMLVEAPPEEAAKFACNAVVIGREVVLPAGCPQVQNQLAALGYRCHPLEMSEFIKAGGACKCLVLWLESHSAAGALTGGSAAGGI